MGRLSRMACLAMLPLVAAAIPATANATGTGMPAGIEAPDWAEQPVRLMMVEQAGCIYCAKWDAEIAPGFDKSSEGLAAPLMRVDIDGPWPDGIVLDSRPVITPTFILVDRGTELARIEGYVGETYFYPVLAEMMQDAGIAVKR